MQREYLKRIKLAFDANDVEMPSPHMKLVSPDFALPEPRPPRAAE